MKLLRALAVDFDGTLTAGGYPTADVLERLWDYRAAGGQVILATGRILDELLEVFEDVLDHVDTLVVENGGVLVNSTDQRLLAEPLPDVLFDALDAAGIPVRRGQLLGAGRSEDAGRILETIRSVGIDAHLAFNRGELMVVPNGVTKGRGVTAALRDSGLSPHNAMAVGDAENDRSMLRACEVSAAPANAVPAVRAMVDLALGGAHADGVVELLDRFTQDEASLLGERWHVDLGTFRSGAPVLVPVSGTNLLVTGGSKGGKSYVAGLIAEQLIDQGYRTLVIDPEGDHVGLSRLHNVTWLGGPNLPPSPLALEALVGGHVANLVVDLSHLTLDEKTRWCADLPEYIVGEREAKGRPHWVVLDEAHLIIGDEERAERFLRDRQTQYCFVTFLPDLVPAVIRERLDTVAIVGHSPMDTTTAAEVLAPIAAVDPARLERRLGTTAPATAVLLRRGHPGVVSSFSIRGRHTSHVRHWHKYAERHLPAAQQFYFRSSPSAPTGNRAASLAEFFHVLVDCSPTVITHHASGGDFSRWIREVISDQHLADVISLAECRACEGTDPEEVREAIAHAIQQRYLVEFEHASSGSEGA